MKKIFSLFSLIFLIVTFALNAVNAAPRRCIVRKNKQNDIKEQPVETLQEFKDCEITAWGCLDLMPSTNESIIPKKEEAYYVVKLGIDKDAFLKKYKIEKIELNGKPVKDKNITYKYDSNGFRFYSVDFKLDVNNVVEIIIRNLETNEKYLKRLNDVEVEIAE